MYRKFNAAMLTLLLAFAWFDAALAGPADYGYIDGAPLFDTYKAASLTTTGTVAVQTNGQATLQAVISGTGAGLTYAFQCSAEMPASTWFTVPAYSVDTGVVTTSWSAQTGQFKISSAGCPWMRVNVTGISGGTFTAKLNASVAGAGGPVTVVGPGGTGALLPDMVVTGSASSAAVLSGYPIDASGYGQAGVMFTSVGSGNTLVAEVSSDNTNWVATLVTRAETLGGGSGASISGLSTTQQYAVKVTQRYFRWRISSYGSGTVTALTTFKAVPMSTIVSLDAGGQNIGNVSGTIASGSADSGGPVKIGGKYNLTTPTFSDGQRADAQLDSRGSLRAMLMGADSATPLANGADGDNISNGANALYTLNREHYFDGTAWPRAFTCPLSAPISVTAGSTTQLVALAASQVIRVCAFVITESLAGTAKFVYGTGANCGTGTTDLTGAMAVATNASVPIAAGAGSSLLRTAAGNALCLTAVTGNITGFVSYVQY